MIKKRPATTPRAKVQAHKRLPPQTSAVCLPPLPLPMNDAKEAISSVPEPSQQWFLALGPLDKSAFDTVLDRLLVARDTDVTIYALAPGEERWRDVAQIVHDGFLDPPPVRDERESKTRGMADVTSHGPSHAVPPPLPPALPPPPMPSALHGGRLQVSGVASKNRDELTPIRPVPLNLLVDAKVLSSLSSDDPTISVEVPSLHADHAGLSLDLAKVDIDDVCLPQPDEAITLPPPALDDTTGRSWACPEEEAPERLQPREQKDYPASPGDHDEELMTPPGLPAAPPTVAQTWVGSQAETQRESELSVNFLVNPERQSTRDREQSTSASMVIQPITEHDQLKPDTRGENNKRSHARYRITTSVGLASEHNFWTGLTQDLSTGGIFVATYANLPLGSQIVLSLSLPDGGPKLEVKAEVRWLRVMREDPEQWPGVGLRFVDLSSATKRRIERCLKMRDAMLFEE